MAPVETVRGPIDAAELGTVLVHEHLRIRDEAVAAQWPDRYDADSELATAVEAVRAAAGHGVRTIVDPSPMFAGRDIGFMRRVSDKTGVQIVACTGIYTYGYLPHYFENRDADQMAELFVSDIEAGIQETDAKAAFLKCAADAPGVTESVEKVHRAVARASVQTGAPIMAHSRPASNTGPRQVEIFREEGVDPALIQIAHTGDTDDLDYIERLLDAGVFIGMDRYGLEMFLSIDRRNATLAELLRRGYADRMLISQDFCATIDWFPQQAAEAMVAQGLIRDWSMTLVFDQVLPALRDEGVLTDEYVETMLVDNPRRWLTAGR
ncbi:MAG: phosphotriesterase [Candidatus Rokuibacteriota bacterium]|nr:MAG: phosphotriesterase [Candidatus Rokubacteria bacterium]